MKIGIVGCGGRMGRMLIKQVLDHPACTLAGASEAPGNGALGQDPGVLVGSPATGLVIGDDAKALFQVSDGVIDFTAPQVTLAHAALAAETRTALIVGTTGFDAAAQAALAAFAARTVIFQAANFSIGVNLLLGLSEQVGRLLGNEYDAEILEMHHKHKVDAPSGTALALGRAVASGRGVDLDAVAERVRDGITGARTPGDIGFATLRGGAVIGDHTVMFAADGERIELTHKASDRSIYSSGAVRAALWCQGRDPGFYGMRDLLGFA
ncbi:MAG: 4-hydroxy-tetrahydrodipicolinate reductase [Rhodospirillales bacterium]|nr:4-hydroxy-tetrahydrodipicolinate reductase [Rhodospirillales bacterium]